MGARYCIPNKEKGFSGYFVFYLCFSLIIFSVRALDSPTSIYTTLLKTVTITRSLTSVWKISCFCVSGVPASAAALLFQPLSAVRSSSTVYLQPATGKLFFQQLQACDRTCTPTGSGL